MLPASTLLYTQLLSPEWGNSTGRLLLVENTATRRKSGADLVYVYTEVVMGLVSVSQQTPSLGKIILQMFRGVKPTRGN